MSLERIVARAKRAEQEHGAVPDSQLGIELWFADGSACSRVQFRHETTADGRHLVHTSRRVWCDDESKLDTCDAAKFAKQDAERMEATKRNIIENMGKPIERRGEP
jgi:hypothetical protein